MNFKSFLQSKYSEYYIMASVLLLYCIVTFFYILFTEPINNSSQELRIQHGSTLTEISNQLEEMNVISNKHFFIFLTKFKSSQTKLRSGFYNIDKVKNYNQLINLLKTGQNLSTKVTIPEGTTIQEIAHIVRKSINIDSTRFIQLCNDSNYIQTLNIDAASLEGYLFPDTYFFYKNDVEKTIIKKMVNNFHVKWNRIKQNLSINDGKSLHEILTLASLIEGECILDDERPIVSSLYQNRLKRRMKLEADPTIQYIIEDSPRRLLLSDLQIDSPYNTYKNLGLPPGPINNPGEKSILAALRPAKTNFLYMVAEGDGSHFFTRSYNSFLNAKKKFQKVRRKTKEKN